MSDARDFKSGAWGPIGGANVPWQGSIVEPQAMRINVGGSWRDVWENFSEIIAQNYVIKSGSCGNNEDFNQNWIFPNLTLAKVLQAEAKGYNYIKFTTQVTRSNFYMNNGGYLYIDVAGTKTSGFGSITSNLCDGSDDSMLTGTDKSCFRRITIDRAKQLVQLSGNTEPYRIDLRFSTKSSGASTYTFKFTEVKFEHI